MPLSIKFSDASLSLRLDNQHSQSVINICCPIKVYLPNATHGDIEITKNHLSQNWHGGFSQGDLDGTIFAESLLKQLKQKMGMDDPFTPVYFEEISFCYDGDNGKFHGFTLAQISTADKPDQQIFLMILIGLFKKLMVIGHILLMIQHITMINLKEDLIN